MRREHKRAKHVTLRLLWLEYKQAHPDGWGYTQFCTHHQRSAARTWSCGSSTPPAGRLFVDFAADTVPVTDPETAEVWGCAALRQRSGRERLPLRGGHAPSGSGLLARRHVRTLEFALTCASSQAASSYVPGGDLLPERGWVGSDQRGTSLQLEANDFSDGHDVGAPGAAATETDLSTHEIALVAASLAQQALIACWAFVNRLPDEVLLPTQSVSEIGEQDAIRLTLTECEAC